MTVPLLWFLCVFVWADMNAADSSQPKRYLTMLRMGKRTERSALTDVQEGDELNDEQYIILYPGRSTPGSSSSDRTRQAFFKVPRVGRRSAAQQHADLTEKELAKRKAAGYDGFDVNVPLLYDEY